MNQEKLKITLELHREWVLNNPDGERANLQGADLQGADLLRANLRGADLLRADLRDADLRDADLRGADLEGADLQGADLLRADLRGADLRGADLRGADLRGADLRGADLRDADLRDADLRDADLRDADLLRADLQGADLRGADLQGAKLDPIREDFFSVLSVAKSEVTGLMDALMRGKVDGTAYKGECACLVGTIANIRHEKYDSLGIELKPDPDRPAEKWFLAIKKGDTPDNNSVAAITLNWIKEFMEKAGLPIPEYRP